MKSTAGAINAGARKRRCSSSPGFRARAECATASTRRFKHPASPGTRTCARVAGQVAEINRRGPPGARVLGLDDILKKRPRTLSGGQRQRVAMGRAIVREPQAFLMDEPLSNLDAKLRVQMRAEVARIQRDLRVTTIYVTHDQSEALTLGDRVAVMRRGELQQLAEPQRLYRDPDNLFVAEFIGSPALNPPHGEP